MKRKTIKSISKRFKITKTGKVKKVKSGQNHFNSGESGKITRNKRRDQQLTNKKQNQTIKRLTLHI
jgi:large subunit ribosomal protein L35